jgi:hypothetical protein
MDNQPCETCELVLRDSTATYYVLVFIPDSKTFERGEVGYRSINVYVTDKHYARLFYFDFS